MPRRKNLIRPAELHATIPETEKARLDLALFSPLEGKVPFGAYQAFVLEAIRIKYEWVGLDLHDVAPNWFPAGTLVKGPAATIASLKHVLTLLTEPL